MKHIALAAVAAFISTGAFAQTTSSAITNSDAMSSALNAGNAQNIHFNSKDRGTRTIYSTPTVYTAPSAFGFSNQNCGASDTATVGLPWGSIGGSKTREMVNCETRNDTILLVQLGLQDAARMRMTCFGSDSTRMAFEAAGGVCPSSGTAKGIEGATTGPKFYVASARPDVLKGRIGTDGVQWEE